MFRSLVFYSCWSPLRSWHIRVSSTLRRRRDLKPSGMLIVASLLIRPRPNSPGTLATAGHFSRLFGGAWWPLQLLATISTQGCWQIVLNCFIVTKLLYFQKLFWQVYCGILCFIWSFHPNFANPDCGQQFCKLLQEQALAKWSRA